MAVDTLSFSMISQGLGRKWRRGIAAFDEGLVEDKKTGRFCRFLESDSTAEA